MVEKLKFWFDSEDELPQEAIEANKKRKKLLIAMWILPVAFVIMVTVVEKTTISEILEDVTGYFGGLMAIGIVICSAIYGVVLFKHIYVKLFVFFSIIPIIHIVFVIVSYGALLMLNGYTGWIFIIIDSILFFKKKPLIHRKEAARILENLYGS